MSAAQTRKLPRADIAATKLGLSRAQMGNPARHVSFRDAQGTADAAWGLGIRSNVAWFDTAVSGEVRQALRERGLLAAAAPVPACDGLHAHRRPSVFPAPGPARA